MPIEASGERTAKALPDAQYLVYSGAPHGLWYTEKDRLNADLIAFINDNTVAAGEPLRVPEGNFPGL